MTRKPRRFAEGGDIPDFSRLTFKEAFAAARGGPGQKTAMNEKFTWNGKTYSTKLDNTPNESAAETARLKRQNDAKAESPKPAAKPAEKKSEGGSKAGAVAAGAAAAAAAGVGIASRRSPSISSGMRGGGGSGGAGKSYREPTLGSDLDPKKMIRDEEDSRFADEGNPNYRKGGKVKAPAKGYARGGMVYAPASEPKRSYPKKK